MDLHPPNYRFRAFLLRRSADFSGHIAKEENLKPEPVSSAWMDEGRKRRRDRAPRFCCMLRDSRAAPTAGRVPRAHFCTAGRAAGEAASPSRDFPGEAACHGAVGDVARGQISSRDNPAALSAPRTNLRVFRSNFSCFHKTRVCLCVWSTGTIFCRMMCIFKGR